MKISKILLSAKEKLKDFSESPELDAEILLSEVLEVSREFLFSRPDFLLSSAQIQKFGIFLQKRISGFSVATILGKKDFFGREFFVDENVLIPRPETEILLQKMIEFLREKKSGRIIDIGTGSGILVISLFLEFGERFEISAIDISEKALKIAKKNAEKFGAKIDFYHADFRDFLFRFSDGDSGPPIGVEGRLAGMTGVEDENFPLFLAVNLPYVPEKDRHFSTKREPENAIFSGNDGLDDYCDFFEILEKVDFEAVFFEFHPPQKEFFEKLFMEKFPKYSVEFFQDFSGDWRIGVLRKSK